MQADSRGSLPLRCWESPAEGPIPPPPETTWDPVVDTLHGVVLTDPYRWLEDQDSPETRAWIAAQNAYAEQIVGESALRAGLEARLRELMEAPGPV